MSQRELNQKIAFLQKKLDEVNTAFLDLKILCDPKNNSEMQEAQAQEENWFNGFRNYGEPRS